MSYQIRILAPEEDADLDILASELESRSLPYKRDQESLEVDTDKRYELEIDNRMAVLRDYNMRENFLDTLVVDFINYLESEGWKEPSIDDINVQYVF